MKTQLLIKKTISYEYMDEPAERDEYEYLCPCGNGKIVETHDDTPGNREQLVRLLCDECKKRYQLDISKGVYNWELEEIKVDKWEEFIKSLDDRDYSDFKEYLQAIKYISEINADKIDEDGYRAEINDNLERIVTFINSHQDYYEISLIEGFYLNEQNGNNWKIDGRDYYYYIADQQMKATVYYARYLNFIENCIIKEEQEHEVKERLKNYCCVFSCDDRNEVLEKCTELLEVIKSNNEISNEQYDELRKVLYDKTNKHGEETTEKASVNEIEINSNELFLDIQAELTIYSEEWEIANNIEYKIYMMFNNMMREIRFFGAAYQYLWHWNMKKKNLYRSGTLSRKQEHDTSDFSKKSDFFKQMFKDCVGHMNSPSKERHSFSENLLIDIYKYLILESDTNSNPTIICDESGLSCTCNSIENTKTVNFNIIKNACINSIFNDNNALSFYEYVVKGNPKVDGYSVEMYPQDLQGERNDKGTVKGMRDTLLPLYFASWGIRASLSKTTVADDKEVITYGKCYNNKQIIEGNSSVDFNTVGDSTLFYMDLSKEDVICLLLRIYKKKRKLTEGNKVAETIVDEINSKMKFSNQLKGKFEEYFEGKFNKWSQCFIFDKVNGNPFMIDIQANEQYRVSLKEKSLQEAAKQLKSDIENNTKEYFIKRYSGIIKKNVKADFILSTISDNEFNFELISKYNEYMAVQEDSEIAMLKYLIFKEA